MTVAAFQKLVWKFYEAEGRTTLPWRKTKDPYRILVSEVMLQQTQVERVIPYYERFLKRFPSVEALSQAPLSEVLTLWQGLGYNRRAKMLHEAAKVIARDYGGKFPKSPEALEKLPGIGHYTARAVAAFAYNQDVVFIETNIRTVVTHHFYPGVEGVSDKDLLLILEKALPKGRAREWYAALMDYGARLKRSGVKLNAKSAHYTKQNAFAGSDRQARGAILKALTKAHAPKATLLALLGDDRKSQLEAQLAKLTTEGFVEKEGRSCRLKS